MHNKCEIEHAVRYAIEATKLFNFERYRQLYPHIFQHAKIDTRLAVSEKDYYVPPSLADECIVVTDLRFEKLGCLRLACFPFKENMLPCEKHDLPQWVPLGRGYTVACQSACDEKETIDADWVDGKCIERNPYKKVVAMFPERAFERESKHHGGLDYVDGQIRLTPEYCQAYGLDYWREDCYLESGQGIGEFFLGKTIYRTVKIATEGGQSAIVRGAPPSDVRLEDLHVKAVTKKASRWEPLDASEFEEPTSLHELATDIAKELAIDIGIDLSVGVVKKILMKRVPKLIGKVTSDIAFKSALTQAVVRSYSALATKSLRLTGRILGAANTVFFVYGIVSMVLDIVDPYNYEKVFSRETLAKINLKLDLAYFGREDNFDREITPEFVWDVVLIPEDDSPRYEYMVEKIKEYLKALRETDTTLTENPQRSQFEFQKRKVEWDVIGQVIIPVTFASLMLVFYEWFHVWALMFLLALMYWGNNK